MQIDLLSLFPQIAAGALSESILKRAQQNGFVHIGNHNLRDWATDRHRTTDDMPYGGGPGMVMKCEPIFAAVEALTGRRSKPEKFAGDAPPVRVVAMSPAGKPFTQARAAEFARESHLVVMCGHYEGIDQRVLDHLVDDEISIGDYVLTNGVIAALVFIDAIVRLVPGVLGDNESAQQDSFGDGLLEGPQFTRPAEFRGARVPEILLSGDHGAIARWRREQALAKTREVRPDLLRGDQQTSVE
jgi:tRNA (guanine37-N1)-methyltransferase